MIIMTRNERNEFDIAHNTIIGRKIQHPPSTNFHDDNPLPAKRLKTFESTDGDVDFSGDEALIRPDVQCCEIPDSDAESDLDGDELTEVSLRPTDLESALPPVESDKDAIGEYEAMRAAERKVDGGVDVEKRIKEMSWARGRSSIYVDAFNLALETVLDDEGHLFDKREREVFRLWRGLEYEAQYL
jgi:Fanconi-associated nuclease 1